MSSAANTRRAHLRARSARLHRLTRAATLLALCIACPLPAPSASAGSTRAPEDPIKLAFTEGDVAGQTTITTPGGKAIGFVTYRQSRRGDLLEARRVAYFADGSSDEDTAIARVGTTLEALRGRSVIRDTNGEPLVDLTIDVAGGRVRGFYRSRSDDEREPVDERVELPPSTYWGPLIFLVAKNFAANAEDERVRFRTVAPTPKPRVLTMELAHTGRTTLRRFGTERAVDRYTLNPTLGWAIDPLLRAILPSTEFLMEPGNPPSLALYTGPRNYAQQEIRLE